VPVHGVWRQGGLENDFPWGTDPDSPATAEVVLKQIHDPEKASICHQPRPQHRRLKEGQMVLSTEENSSQGQLPPGGDNDILSVSLGSEDIFLVTGPSEAPFPTPLPASHSIPFPCVLTLPD
jgi:hypothetical protein